MILLPPNKQWKQNNRSDLLGSLRATFNADLNIAPSKIRASRLLATTTTTDDASLTAIPVGFKYFNDGGSTKIWTVAGSRVHSSVSAVANAVFGVDATSGTPTTCDSTASDIEVFNGHLYVTTYDGAGDKLYKKTAGSTWAANGTGLGATSGTHMLTVYANRLYISRGNNSIYSMNTSDVIATSSTYTLTLDTNYRVTAMRSASNRIWIFTIATTGKGYVFEWDGASTQPTRSYRLDAAGAVAGVIKDDIPWLVDTNGRLMVYSNGTFVEVDRFPINEKFLSQATDSTNTRFMHPNGMSVINDKINILMNNVIGDNGSTIEEYCPSGIWEYDTAIGLYHKYAFSYMPVTTTTVTDFGQIRISGAGALSEMKLPNTASNATGSLLAGAKIYTDASATTVGIFTNDTRASGGLRAASIITSKIESQQVLEDWQEFISKYRQLLSSDARIRVKYRTTEAAALEASITWTSTTTFTTTTNVLGREGQEVEGIQGTGSGKTAHITLIDSNAGTYTVTVDEAFTGASGTAKVRIQDWVSIGNITDQTSQFTKMRIDKSTTWLQIRVCVIFTILDEFEQAILTSKPHQLAQ